MKKYLVVMLFLFSVLNCFASSKDFKVLYYDYSLNNIFPTYPLSAGMCTWSDGDKEHESIIPSLYGSVAMLTYKDIVRFEIGVCSTIHKDSKWIDVSMLTGISTLIKERFVVGVWMAPFWNLYGSNPNDAFGVMIGYSF